MDRVYLNSHGYPKTYRRSVNRRPLQTQQYPKRGRRGLIVPVLKVSRVSTTVKRYLRFKWKRAFLRRSKFKSWLQSIARGDHLYLYRWKSELRLSINRLVGWVRLRNPEFFIKKYVDKCVVSKESWEEFALKGLYGGERIRGINNLRQASMLADHTFRGKFMSRLRYYRMLSVIYPTRHGDRGKTLWFTRNRSLLYVRRGLRRFQGCFNIPQWYNSTTVGYYAADGSIRKVKINVRPQIDAIFCGKPLMANYARTFTPRRYAYLYKHLARVWSRLLYGNENFAAPLVASRARLDGNWRFRPLIGTDHEQLIGLRFGDVKSFSDHYPGAAPFDEIMNNVAPFSYDEEDYLPSDPSSSIDENIFFEMFEERCPSPRANFYDRTTNLLRPFSIIRTIYGAAAFVKKLKPAFSEVTLNNGASHSYFFNNINLLKLGGLISNRYFCFFNNIGRSSRPRRTGYVLRNKPEADRLLLRSDLPPTLVTLAAMRALFGESYKMWKGRRPAFLSASHALWLYNVVRAVRYSETAPLGEADAVFSTYYNKRGDLELKGPGIYPRILLHGGGRWRYRFLSKVAHHFRRTARDNLSRLWIATSSIDGQCEELAYSKTLKFFTERNKKKREEDLLTFNDGLDYKLTNTTKTVYSLLKGQAKFIEGSKKSLGDLAAFRAAGSLLNRRDVLIKYASTFVKILFSSSIPNLAGKSDTSISEEVVSLLKNSVVDYYKEFMRSVTSTMPGQVGDLYMTPYIGATAREIDKADIEKRRFFTRNPLNSGSDDRSRGEAMLDWFSASGINPFSSSGRWIIKKYQGMIIGQDHVFEPGVNSRANFSNYYFGNSFKFNKFIYNIVDFASILKKKYQIDLFDVFRDASDGAAEQLGSGFKKFGGSGVVNKMKAISRKLEAPFTGLLSIIPQLRRRVIRSLDSIERGRVKHFLVKHVLLRYVEAQYKKNFVYSDNFKKREDAQVEFLGGLKIRPYTIQKRNIELRRGRDAYIFFIPKKRWSWMKGRSDFSMMQRFLSFRGKKPNNWAAANKSLSVVSAGIRRKLNNKLFRMKIFMRNILKVRYGYNSIRVKRVWESIAKARRGRWYRFYRRFAGTLSHLVHSLGFSSSERMGEIVVKCGLVRVNNCPTCNDKLFVAPGSTVSVSRAFYMYWSMRCFGKFMAKWVYYPNTQDAFKHAIFERSIRVMRAGDVLVEYRKGALATPRAMGQAQRALGSMKKTRYDSDKRLGASLDQAYLESVGYSERDKKMMSTYVKPAYGFSMLKNIDYARVGYRRDKRKKRMRSVAIAKRVLSIFLRAHNGLAALSNFVGNPFLARAGNVALLRRIPGNPEEIFSVGYAKKRALYNPTIFGLVYNHRHYY